VFTMSAKAGTADERRRPPLELDRAGGAFENRWMVDGGPLPPCRTCGKEIRVLSERDRLVFYICDACGTRGAFDRRHPPPPRDEPGGADSE